MANYYLHFLPVLSTALLLLGCEKLIPEKVTVLNTSKDFWIDRCDLTYRGKHFPIRGRVSDVVELLGPNDRFSDIGSRYFWDDLGLQLTTNNGLDRILSAELLFNHEESSSEMGMRLANLPEYEIQLAELRGSRPQGFFRGDLVLEGALIGQEVDFDNINKIRAEYFKTQTGPDAQAIAIQESWSSTRYAFERNCADGKHLRFIFTLLSLKENTPLQLESITIGSDNVPDVTNTHEAKPQDIF